MHLDLKIFNILSLAAVGNADKYIYSVSLTQGTFHWHSKVTTTIWMVRFLYISLCTYFLSYYFISGLCLHTVTFFHTKWNFIKMIALKWHSQWDSCKHALKSAYKVVIIYLCHNLAEPPECRSIFVIACLTAKRHF